MQSKIARQYVEFVGKNESFVGQTESFVRILSYLIPGNSQLLSELLYAVSNLLVFVNDGILRIKHSIELPVAEQKLSNWVTVLEYIEVFVELAGDKVGGNDIRWGVVLVIQLVKAFLRLILLLYHESGVQSSPLIPPLHRKKFPSTAASDQSKASLRGQNRDDDEDDEEEEEEEDDQRTQTRSGHEMTFTLKHSKRKVRCLSGTPPLAYRGWSVPQEEHPASLSLRATLMDNRMNAGETLHIMRPLVHMASLHRNGEKSWYPWLVSFAMDLLSLYLLGNTKKFSFAERKEIQRRGSVMLLYLLRSPFYDRYTKLRLLSTLHHLTETVPILRILTGPLHDYIPYWQKVYGYVWMI